MNESNATIFKEKIMETTKLYAQPVGSAIGGALGNAQLGGSIGGLAGQLGQMLPFSADPMAQSGFQPASTFGHPLGYPRTLFGFPIQQPLGNPFGSPFGTPLGSPFGSPMASPFASPFPSQMSQSGAAQAGNTPAGSPSMSGQGQPTVH
jgi:hypothetical protein